MVYDIDFVLDTIEGKKPEVAVQILLGILREVYDDIHDKEMEAKEEYPE